MNFPPYDSNSRSKKSFHLLWFSLSKYVNPSSLQGFAERANIYHSKAPVGIIIDDNISLNFISFSIPEEGTEEFVYFFDSIRILT